MTPERRREPADTDGLAELFHAAVESRRSSPDLMRVILAGALPLAGADVALICGPDGALVAFVATEGISEESVGAFALQATQVATRESVDEHRYVSRLTATAPYVFAMRWARGRSANHDVARAVAGAVARLLLRNDEDVEPMREGAMDPLTELPTRTSTLRHLDNALAAAQRGGGRVGVLFIDLDGFKTINDTFGHAVGDQTLIEAGRRMRDSMRRNDFVGRLGGDEFVAILTVVDDELEMAEAAQRFLDRLFIEVQDGGFSSLVRASIGISVSPEDGITPEQLLQHADEALYAAKESGGNAIRWYRDGLSQEVRARREFRDCLRDANLSADRIGVDHAGDRGRGVDALAAPVAGLAHAARVPGFQGRRDGVVGARRQSDSRRHRVTQRAEPATQRADSRQHLQRQLRRVGGDGEHDSRRRGRLYSACEPTMLADTEACGSFLRDARRMGVPIGLDGFGSAPTSLTAMAALPLDFIKIDRRVTNPTAQEVQWKRVARTAIGIAQTLQIRAIADGVEEREQARWLVENGVEALQGYLIAQPMTAPDFADWLKSSRAGVRDVW